MNQGFFGDPECVREAYFVAPFGLYHLLLYSGLRPGLHSCAASRLLLGTFPQGKLEF